MEAVRFRSHPFSVFFLPTNMTRRCLLPALGGLNLDAKIALALLMT